MNRHPTSMTMLAAAIAVCSATAGCAALDSSPNLNGNFGEAVRQDRAMQTARPEASTNRDPVAGIDGEAAVNAIGVYRNSFKAPPQTFGVFGLGGTSLGGTQQ